MTTQIAAVQMPQLPKKRRQFLCTKCGSSKCVQGQEGFQHPDCAHCFYQGFAEDVDYNDSEMHAYAQAHAAQRCAELEARLAVAKVEPTAQPCGGCGESRPNNRCIGCFHNFAAIAAGGKL